MHLIKPSVSSSLAILHSDLVQHHNMDEGASMQSSLSIFRKWNGLVLIPSSGSNRGKPTTFFQKCFLEKKKISQMIFDEKNKKNYWRRKKLMISQGSYHNARWSCKPKPELKLLTMPSLHGLFWFCKWAQRLYWLPTVLSVPHTVSIEFGIYHHLMQ